MENINIKNVLDKSTGFFLLCYIISAAVFENYTPTARLSKFTLYSFALLAFVYILNKKKVRITYYSIATFLYGIILGISFLYTPNVYSGIQTIYWYYACALLTFYVVNYIDNIKKVYLIINAYIFTGMVLALFLFSFYGMEIFNIAANSTHGFRIGSEIGNENTIGLALSMSCVFAIYMMFYHSFSNKVKIIYFLDIFICFPIMLLTGSKKALLLIIFGTLWFIVLKRPDKRNIIKKITYILIGVLFIFIGYWIVTNVEPFWFMTERIDEFIMTLQGNSTSDSDMVRIYMIKTGLDSFSDSPILGNGVAYSRFVFGTYSHNNYVEILMNTGIVGFFIYYSFYIISILKSTTIKSNEQHLKILVLFIITSSMILEVGMVSYYNRYYQVLFAAISTIFYKNNIFFKEVINEKN